MQTQTADDASAKPADSEQDLQGYEEQSPIMSLPQNLNSTVTPGGVEGNGLTLKVCLKLAFRRPRKLFHF